MKKMLQKFLNNIIQVSREEFSFFTEKKPKNIKIIYSIEIILIILYFFIPQLNKEVDFYKNSFQASQFIYIPIILIILVFIEIYFRIKEKITYLGIFPFKFLGILFIAVYYFDSIFILPNNIYYIFLQLILSTVSNTVAFLLFLSIFTVYFHKKFTTISYLKSILYLSTALFLFVGILVQVLHTNQQAMKYTDIYLVTETINANKEHYCKDENIASIDSAIAGLYYSNFEAEYYSKTISSDLIYNPQKEHYISTKIKSILNLNCQTKIALINQQQKINESIIKSHYDHFSNFLNVLIIPNIFVIFNFLNNKKDNPINTGYK